MAYAITDFDGGALPVSATNPFGAILDGTTIINSKSINDMEVFFQKMLETSGALPNNTPDNTPNGLQFWTAFLTVYGIEFTAAFLATGTAASIATLNNEVADGAWTNITLATGWSAGGNVPQYRVDGKGRVYLRGEAVVTGSATGTIATLPSSAFPTPGTLILSCFTVISSAYTPSWLSISVSGVMVTPTYASGDAVYFDGISYLNS